MRFCLLTAYSMTRAKPSTAKTVQTSAKPSMWQPLRHRVFKKIWIASVFSNIGTWMHEVGAGWLMTSLAPDPLMVALVQAATTFPVFLLALPAGALPSRVHVVPTPRGSGPWPPGQAWAAQSRVLWPGATACQCPPRRLP